MILFADTNWLVALYFVKKDPDRTSVVERFQRRRGQALTVSEIVLLEARNVFSHLAGEAESAEWQRLRVDFHRRIYVDPMNWLPQRDKTWWLFERYSHKAKIGSFDAALVASALLCGADYFLSWDGAAAALAASEGLKVFPDLDQYGKKLLATLRR